MINAHYNGDINIFDYWNVGDIRSIHLSAMEAKYVNEFQPEQTLDFVIIGIEHDDLVESINDKTKAAITVQVKTILSKSGQINSTSPITGGWKECERRKWCNEVFKGSIPEIIRNFIKPVNKLATIQGNETEKINIVSDECFLLSCVELNENKINNIYYNKDEGEAYKYYQTLGNAMLSEEYWVRSPMVNSSYFWTTISVDGVQGYVPPTSSLHYIRPAFCL